MLIGIKQGLAVQKKHALPAEALDEQVQFHTLAARDNTSDRSSCLGCQAIGSSPETNTATSLPRVTCERNFVLQDLMNPYSVPDKDLLLNMCQRARPFDVLHKSFGTTSPV